MQKLFKRAVAKHRIDSAGGKIKNTPPFMEEYFCYYFKKLNPLTIGGSFAFPAQTEKKQMMRTTSKMIMQTAPAIGTRMVQNRIIIQRIISIETISIFRA